jgi:hypothetical protein
VVSDRNVFSALKLVMSHLQDEPLTRSFGLPATEQQTTITKRSIINKRRCVDGINSNKIIKHYSYYYSYYYYYIILKIPHTQDVSQY